MNASVKPLAGKLVAVTRATQPRDELVRRLRKAGAKVLRWPALEICLPEHPAPLDRALDDIETYDWLVFTSAVAVHAIAERRSTAPRRPKIAAVGRATAAAVKSAGWHVELLPRRASAAALADLIVSATTASRILFPASASALPTLAERLRQAGHQVDQVCCYEVRAPSRPPWTASIPPVDAVTFASPSAVTGVRNALGTATWPALMSKAKAVAIGPTTAEALRAAGVEPACVARSSTMAGLAAAVVETVGGKER